MRWAERGETVICMSGNIKFTQIGTLLSLKSVGEVAALRIVPLAEEGNILEVNAIKSCEQVMRQAGQGQSGVPRLAKVESSHRASNAPGKSSTPVANKEGLPVPEPVRVNAVRSTNESLRVGAEELLVEVVEDSRHCA